MSNKTKCPICSKMELIEKRGEFRMELPTNIPGGVIVVPEANWLHCKSCGEDILSLELEKAINSQRHGRYHPSSA